MEQPLMRIHLSCGPARLLLAALSIASPNTLRAQVSPPRAALDLSVRSAVARMAGDTVRLSYVVTNRPTSSDSLFEFIVDVASPPVRVITPPGDGRWAAFSRYGNRPVAGWTALSSLPRPGQSTPRLEYESVGLLDIVRYSALRYTEPQEAELSDDPDTLPPPAANRGAQVFAGGADRVTGFTVGVTAIPRGATSSSLVTRLQRLLARACDEVVWITQPGVCHSLDVKLGHAGAALAANATESARGSLQAFAQELDAQHGDQPGKHVTDEAYALLAGNVRYLLAHL